MNSPAQLFIKDVVGVRVFGTRLRIQLVDRAPDFLARLALPFFCAIPPRTPINPNGIMAPLPSAGPYVIRRWEPRREIVLERNPYYRGPRPRNPARVVYTIGLNADHQYQRVNRNQTDWIRPTGRYARDPAVRRSPLPSTDFLTFDTRPGHPFAEPRLRKAVALVIHRARIATIGGTASSSPVDHLLPTTVPGYRPARIFPLRANARALERARSLARGLVPAKVKLIAWNRNPWPERAAFIAHTLRQIDLDVDVKLFPRGVNCLEPMVGDVMQDSWFADYPDPGGLFRYLLEPRPHTDWCAPIQPVLKPRWLQRYRAAERLVGPARLRALGALDVALSRDGVPGVALLQPNELNLFSARIGCFRPHRVYQVDIGALCLR